VQSALGPPCSKIASRNSVDTENTDSIGKYQQTPSPSHRDRHFQPELSVIVAVKPNRDAPSFVHFVYVTGRQLHNYQLPRTILQGSVKVGQGSV
jgi:hypothetical protein